MKTENLPSLEFPEHTTEKALHWLKLANAENERMKEDFIMHVMDNGNEDVIFLAGRPQNETPDGRTIKAEDFPPELVQRERAFHIYSFRIGEHMTSLTNPDKLVPTRPTAEDLQRYADYDVEATTATDSQFRETMGALVESELKRVMEGDEMARLVLADIDKL